MVPKNPNPRCKGRTKSGNRCRAAPTAGGLCFFHANPNKASELGRIGGRSKRAATSESANPLPELHTAIAVRDAVARLIADVYAGKLDPRVASGLAPLLNLQLRAIETTDLERRLAKIEKLLDETQTEAALSAKVAPKLESAEAARRMLMEKLLGPNPSGGGELLDETQAEAALSADAVPELDFGNLPMPKQFVP
jgi:Family of unknown function (DUF5763)